MTVDCFNNYEEAVIDIGNKNNICECSLAFNICTANVVMELSELICNLKYSRYAIDAGKYLLVNMNYSNMRPHTHIHCCSPNNAQYLQNTKRGLKTPSEVPGSKIKTIPNFC